MSVEFSEHALEQMKERGIGKMLEVVTITEGPRITVVTAYYPEEELNEN